jgi:hypothetical protein
VAGVALISIDDVRKKLKPSWRRTLNVLPALTLVVQGQLCAPETKWFRSAAADGADEAARLAGAVARRVRARPCDGVPGRGTP